MDPKDILNWRRLTARITTSGQPSEAQLAQLQALGVRHIVNLGLHSHERALADEAASVAALEMNYIHIPVEFAHPAPADYEAFCAAMQAIGDEPVHVHCIVNARVTAFFYRYQREALGTDAREARRMLESVWKPGGVWAAFIGDEAAQTSPHQYAGRDYEVDD